MNDPSGHPTDAILVEYAIRNAGRSITTGKVPLWAAVRDMFAVASASAHFLCRRFGMDPDKEVGRGIECEPCPECQGCRCADPDSDCILESRCGGCRAPSVRLLALAGHHAVAALLVEHHRREEELLVETLAQPQMPEAVMRLVSLPKIEMPPEPFEPPQGHGKRAQRNRDRKRKGWR